MSKKIPIPASLRALATRQGGVFTNSQAQGLGVTRQAQRRMQNEGTWHKLASGLWSTTPSPEWMGLAWAGVLQCPDGVLGGAAAAHLWGFAERPRRIDVWSASRGRTSNSTWRFRSGERSGQGTPSRVRVEEAVLELCAVADESGVVGVLTKALGTGRTKQDRLRTATLQRKTQRNRGLVLDILAELELGVESPLEHRYLHDVERAHGLPRGLRQVSVSEGSRSDVLYEDYGLLVELDGRVWHEGLAVARDMMRDNVHEIIGLTTLRFGWQPVAGAPCVVAEQVATALAQRGWRGEPGVCDRCRQPTGAD